MAAASFLSHLRLSWTKIFIQDILRSLFQSIALNAIPQIQHERMSSLVSFTHFPFLHLKFLAKMSGRTSRRYETMRWFPLRSCFTRLILAGIMVCLTTLFLWGDGSLLQAQELEDLKNGVVKITATAAGQQRVGTGFIVRIEDKTVYILTASHVVEGATLTINFFPNPDKDYAGTTRNMQGGNPKGLAVIKVRGPLPEGIRSLVLASNFAVQGGENVTVIGFRRAPSIQ
jgi:S1-C subfamily serine protease